VHGRNRISSFSGPFRHLATLEQKVPSFVEIRSEHP
jgi:hypothetical protein